VPSGRRLRRAYRPLHGVRILSFEVAYSLPAATRFLAELGAEVVKVAPPRGVGFADYTTVVDGVSLGKPNIAINLKTEDGQALARRLVAHTDVVCSNFTASVMPAFGLGPDDLRAIKSDLIVLRLSGYGAPGPWTSFPAFAAVTEAVGGLNAIQGNAGDPPVRTGSGIFADQLSGMYATLAIVAALEARQRTGEGRFIDLSMAECVTQMLGPSVLEAARDGQLPPRVGNRDLPFAPHGVYPCSGDDEWLALSILDDTHWQALVDLVDDERLRAADLADNAGRTRARATIDGVLSAWTSGFDKRDLAVLLQSVGIAAGPVNTVSDLLFDPHLAARQAFQPVEHAQPMLGYLAHPHPAAAWTAVGRRRATSTDIRANGADNYRVLHAWLGLNRAEVTRLVRGGALTCSGPFRVDEAPDAPEMPRDPTFATRLALATQDR
jgi:crotonobetainyl-CoA:carnitine CoA-transferase CaiB-like acyl-CoA transferase